MAKLRKGGPKKKAGERNAQGRLIPSEDRGTPELLARKLAMTGSSRGDMSGLGVLYGRKIIDETQYQAGLDFEKCYRAYIGRPDPIGSSLERRDRGPSSSEDGLTRRMKIRYWNCLAALNEISPHVFNSVRDICLYERSGGLMGEVIAIDVRRVEGTLIARGNRVLPPDLRLRIGNLCKGLEMLNTVPRADYSREAEELIARLKARDQTTVKPATQLADQLRKG